MPKEQYTQEEKQELLKIARTTLEQKILQEKIYQPENSNPKFQQKRGVFVTLHINGQLRGCIGNIEPVKSIVEAVRDNALAASCEDPRFFPLTRNELADVDIEISILTEPKVSLLEQIKEGEDGVILNQGAQVATFLPQVWKELSTKEQFLSHLCEKAGLDDNCYQSKDTEFRTYNAVVFGEKS
ncbi:AmmeMemoRadiSam system protein A [Patescibacteria group bacterium]|nr:AmmeMemoRadiSam system protein A [Patescibacteria group bacterium]